MPLEQILSQIGTVIQLCFVFLIWQLWIYDLHCWIHVSRNTKRKKVVFCQIGQLLKDWIFDSVRFSCVWSLRNSSDDGRGLTSHVFWVGSGWLGNVWVGIRTFKWCASNWQKHKLAGEFHFMVLLLCLWDIKNQPPILLPLLYWKFFLTTSREKERERACNP